MSTNESNRIERGDRVRVVLDDGGEYVGYVIYCSNTSGTVRDEKTNEEHEIDWSLMTRLPESEQRKMFIKGQRVVDRFADGGGLRTADGKWHPPTKRFEIVDRLSEFHVSARHDDPAYEDGERFLNAVRNLDVLRDDCAKEHLYDYLTRAVMDTICEIVYNLPVEAAVELLNTAHRMQKTLIQTGEDDDEEDDDEVVSPSPEVSEPAIKPASSSTVEDQVDEAASSATDDGADDELPKYCKAGVGMRCEYYIDGTHDGEIIEVAKRGAFVRDLETGKTYAMKWEDVVLFAEGIYSDSEDAG